MIQKRTKLLALVLAFCAAAPVAIARQEQGVDDTKKDDSSSDSKDKDAEQKKKDEKKKKDEDHWFAIKNGDIFTGTGAVLRGAMLLAKNGKIDKIGYDIDLPEGVKTLDVHGLRVYPGLVAIASQGLIGSGSSDFDDTIDPFNSRMVLGLAAGITTTGSGSSAVKLKRFSIDGALLAEKIFTSFTWSNGAPRQKGELHDKFTAAAQYLRDYRDWQKKVKDNKDLPEPAKKNVDNSVLAVLQGEQTAKFVANDRDDLLGIARLAQEFGFRPVIDGCQEGWTIADELGRAGVRAILTPRDRRAKDERQWKDGGTSIENAAILYKAGVQIAIVPSAEGVDLGGIVGRDIQALPLEADFAVRGGLPEIAALQSITVVPARILGIANRVGTLEVGKDCDAIVTDGDVLHYKTFVQWAIVDGKVVYDKEKELYFKDIRPRPAEPKKIDAGETAPKPDAKSKEGEGEKKDAEKKDGDEPKKDGEKKEEKKDGGR